MARRDKRSRSYNAEVSLATVPLLKCLVFGLVRGYYYAPEGRAPLVTPLERRQRPVHGMPSLERTRVAADRTSPCTHTNNGIRNKTRFPAIPAYPRSMLPSWNRTLVDREISISADWLGRPIPRAISWHYRTVSQCGTDVSSGRYAWFMDTRYCSRSCRHNARRCFRSALSTSAQWMSTQIEELNYTMCPHPRVWEICGLKKLIGTQDGGYERIWVTLREIRIAKLINSFN